MVTKEQKMLKELIKIGWLETDLASEFKVHQITIQRWVSGDTTPPYCTRIMIATLYRKYRRSVFNVTKRAQCNEIPTIFNCRINAEEGPIGGGCA